MLRMNVVREHRSSPVQVPPSLARGVHACIFTMLHRQKEKGNPKEDRPKFHMSSPPTGVPSCCITLLGSIQRERYTSMKTTCYMLHHMGLLINLVSLFFLKGHNNVGILWEINKGFCFVCVITLSHGNVVLVVWQGHAKTRIGGYKWNVDKCKIIRRVIWGIRTSN